METNDLIAAEEFCTFHKVEFSFIRSLYEAELIEITTIKEITYIPNDQLQQLEKFVRMHYDLDINVQGIEAIAHLLGRISDLQGELTSVKNRLRLYED
ncbi:chaperone modulator CbpM [Rubrolithibacter danxiaensis]|uniref:chaperone modulator CbpM n=1 Tax=Rubrolithibacter danxiaensis TaxID=3390805 RepID=UPI003BF8B0BD